MLLLPPGGPLWYYEGLSVPTKKRTPLRASQHPQRDSSFPTPIRYHRLSLPSTRSVPLLELSHQVSTRSELDVPSPPYKDTEVL